MKEPIVYKESGRATVECCACGTEDLKLNQYGYCANCWLFSLSEEDRLLLTDNTETQVVTKTTYVNRPAGFWYAFFISNVILIIVLLANLLTQLGFNFGWLK